MSRPECSYCRTRITGLFAYVEDRPRTVIKFDGTVVRGGVDRFIACPPCHARLPLRPPAGPSAAPRPQLA